MDASIHPPLGARRHRAAQHGVLSLAYGEDNTATTLLWQPCQAATLAAGDRVNSILGPFIWPQNTSLRSLAAN
jgi:hypothetical protein